MTSLVTYEQPPNMNVASPTNFKFVLAKYPEVTYFCQTATVPGVSLGWVAQPTVFTPVPVPGNRLAYSDLTFNFIVSEDLSNWNTIYTWMVGLGFPKEFPQFAAQKEDGLYSDGSLFVLSNNKNPIVEVKYLNMFPIDLSQIQWDATEQDHSTIIASVTFKYLLYEIKTVVSHVQ